MNALWSVDDETVISAGDGFMFGAGIGEGVITAKFAGFSGSITVIVEQIVYEYLNYTAMRYS